MPRLLSALLNALLLVLVAITALLAGRLSLAERGLEAALAEKGLQATLRVTGLGPNALIVQDIHLHESQGESGGDPGGESGPSLARLRVAYTLNGLLDRRIAAVEMTGLRGRLDLDRPDPLAPLRPLLAPAAAGSATPETGADITLPRLRLDNAVLTLAQGTTTATLRLAGAIQPRGDDLGASLRGVLSSRAGRLDLSAAASNLNAGGRLHLETSGDLDLAALPWPAAWPGRLAAGDLDLQASLAGRLPPLAALRAGDDALSRAEASGRIRLAVRDAAWAPYSRGSALTADLGLDVQAGAATLRLNAPLTLVLGRLAPQLAAKLSLPPAGADLLARVERLTVSPWTDSGEMLDLRREESRWRLNAHASVAAAFAGGGTARLRLAADSLLEDGGDTPGRLVARTLSLNVSDLAVAGQRIDRLDFDGRGTWADGRFTLPGQLDLRVDRLRLHAARLDGLTLSGPIEVVRDATGLSATLTDTGRLSLPRVPTPAALALATPIEAELYRLSVDRTAAGLILRATLDPGTLKAELATGGGAAQPARLTPGHVTAFCAVTGAGISAELRFDAAEAALPTQGLTATGLAGALRLGARPGALAELTVGRLAQTGPTPLSAPVTGRFALRRSGEILTLGGTVEPLGPSLSLPITGRYGLSDGAGRLQIGPASLAFAPEGLQPADLSPRLDPLSQVRGRLDLEAWAAWSGDALTSGGRLDLAPSEVALPQATVSGLRGTLRFESLWPPRTPPDQRIEAAKVQTLLPLSDLRLRFQIAATAEGAPVLALDQAEARLAEGRVFIEPTRLRPLARSQALTLRVADLSLSQLVALLDLEDISATGRLGGRIPLRMSQGVVTLPGGTLAAEAPGGVLKVRLDGRADALAQRGEAVRMMLRALEDFRYDTLKLDIARPAPGDLGLKVTLQGHNPEVLEGYPFRFNIDLSGDLEPLIAALKEGRQLRSEMLQRALDGSLKGP